MLSSVVRPSRRALLTHARTLVTEQQSSSSHGGFPPSLAVPPTAKPPARSRLGPQPRIVIPGSTHQVLPSLPAGFGKNQRLEVSASTRSLLESVVAQFNAPIKYAFAYGSGVFEQDGYPATGAGGEPPLLDFMFAVSHPAHWHSINMQQNPSHYSWGPRVLGSSFVERVQEVAPGVWFNPYVPMKGVNIKYGVTTVDNLCADLLHWDSLYLAGRMHKPLRIIKDDPRVRLTQQVNLTSAVRAALLTLPPQFSETLLFERIAGISYAGDPRMMLPAENRGKVANIVSKQGPQFKELYRRLAVGLPGVHWPEHGSMIEQDAEAKAKVAHLRKLPRGLISGVRRSYAEGSTSLPAVEADETAYWMALGSDPKLAEVMAQEMAKIVRGPATIQSLKGIVSAGLGKSFKYSAAKVGKWWKGTTTKSS